MIANREAIFTALFSVVSGAANFTTKSRRLKHWGDVPQEAQPALFLTQETETVVAQKGLPSKHTLFADVHIYAKTGEEELTPAATILNPLVDAVEAVLAPDPNLGYYQLVVSGQVISRCWIDGQIDYDGGILGSQAVAIIPVKLLVV